MYQSPKVLDGPVLESNEDNIAIGLNVSGELDIPFLKEVAGQHPPVTSFFRRWTSKGFVAPGSFQGVPGLFTDGAMIRPTFYNLVVSVGDEKHTRTEWIESAIRGAWDEAQIFGFQAMALHAPSIYRGSSDPSADLYKLISKMDFTFPDRFRIYSE